jgi:hypothetical protein
MKEKKLPKSIRKYIRKEKARIRKSVFDIEEQEKLISELYQKFLKKEKINQENPIKTETEKNKNKKNKDNKNKKKSESNKKSKK